MKKIHFTILRALGIIVGLLFVVIGPLAAKDRGLLSFDGISSLLITVTFGLIFIAYGVTGISRLPKLPLRLQALPEASIALFYLILGVTFLLRPEEGLLKRIAGAVLLLFFAASVWVSYAKRKSSPAA